LFKIKRIKFYNLLMLYFYLAIRYKIFVLELGRSVVKELTKHDVYCNHYVLLLDTIVIGTFRLHYIDNVVELGRVALLSDYRNKGYGSLAISQLIKQIKDESKTYFIRLFTEHGNIDFYKKFNFFETGIRFFGNDPYPYMTMMLKVK
jgi:predicted GNAT family N-acyltransferase